MTSTVFLEGVGSSAQEMMMTGTKKNIKNVLIE
jgi:hypothetical protein